MKGFDWQLAGAFSFGLLIGWYVYYVNRYRKGDIQIGDIITLLGAIGGSAVLALFERKTDLFGAYGVGLSIGFFGYFLVLLILVKISPNFDADWFLDGRRKNPADGIGYGTDARPTITPMGLNPTRPQSVMNFYGSNPGEVAGMLMAAQPSNAPATPSGDALRIQAVCAAVRNETGPLGPFRDSAAAFVIEVAHRLGLSLSGSADQIISAIKSSGWTRLRDEGEARDAARQGKLVLAGVRAGEYSPPRMEGHLAVVTAGATQPAQWGPTGYWGSSDPAIRAYGGGSSIGNCFAPDVRGAIVYVSREI